MDVEEIDKERLQKEHTVNRRVYIWINCLYPHQATALMQTLQKIYNTI